jgi:hypothetical protein
MTRNHEATCRENPDKFSRLAPRNKLISRSRDVLLTTGRDFVLEGFLRR